jgi:hypothetical protein
MRKQSPINERRVYKEKLYFVALFGLLGNLETEKIIY